ncbi:MAG: lipase [bacterium]|nr:lipase [bacterium]
MRICFIGDSFVNGTNDEECLGWVGRICAVQKKKGADLTCYNLGVRGETSPDVHKRWFAESDIRLPNEHEQRIVFSFGVNDTKMETGRTRVEPMESMAVCKEIFSAAARQFPVIVIGPPPIEEEGENLRVKEISGGMRVICRNLEIPFFDSFGALIKDPVWMDEVSKFDGNHPSGKGYAVLAGLINQWEPWLEWFKE